NFSHIEAGAIFRKNIGGGTELGKQAKEYIDRGDLVPDEITIPMILDRLKEDDCKGGWILDGFPRNKVQAETLAKALKDEGIKLDYVIEIVLKRDIAKLRITGRRLCVNDNNHPNHIAFDAIKPAEKDGKMVCRVCGGELNTRPDDQDDTAIDKRHDIYYDDNTGTMAAVNVFKALGDTKVISIDGEPSIDDVSAAIMKEMV
ncbi:MAG: nucleoside monophosphate kinase, partial [Thermodesulfobacteriota bacterium]